MHRRLPVAAGAIVVVALTVAACSSSKKAATAGSTTASPAATAASSSGPASAADASAELSGTLVVFAAASLKTTFTALAASFEQRHTGVKVVPSFGGSDTLAAQITAGAPVDVFAAASTATMTTVTKAGDAKGAPADFARNELEIAVSPGDPTHVAALADLTKAGVKLAVCAPTVPCGAAAAKAFAAATLTPHPATLEQDVTSVLTKVELGEVDAGLVYQTDVKSAGSKVTGVNFSEAASAINTYPIVAVTTGKNPAAGQAFVDYVLSPAGQQVLQAAGFQQP
jgi:molybdate transport system substrate-binding protein